MNSKKRVELYDWLRLIATIYVVIGHSTYLTIGSAFGGVDYPMPAHGGFILLTQQISGLMYSFHMPLFFMLSGAVMALRPMSNLDDLIRSKAKRLLLPFFACGLLFMLPVKWLGGFYTLEALPKAAKGIIANSSDTGHLWFLVALFWCMIVFCLLYRITERLGSHSIYLLLFLSALIFIYGSKLPFDVFGLKSGLQYLFYFTIGYIFEKERATHKPLSTRNVFLLFLLFVLIEILHTKWNILGDLSVILIRSCLTLLLAALCTALLSKFTTGKLWDLIIRNLFCVYLFHDPLEYLVLRITFSGTLLNSLAGCAVYAFCRTVGVFLVCLLLGELLRKGKSRV